MDVEKELSDLKTRLEEINTDITSLTEAFLKAGGDQSKARADAARWRAVFEPLFDEHEQISRKLKLFSTTFVGNG